jgi:hypothetical protein
VTSVTPFRLKDVTGALRARRYRCRKKGNEINADVTVDAPGVTAITTGGWRLRWLCGVQDGSISS